MREQTRRQRYDSKSNVQQFPIGIAIANFHSDANVAFVMRTAACFGLDVHVIGSLPEYKELRRYSGTVVDYVVTSLYKSPGAFLEAARTGGWRLVSAELTEAAKPIVGFPWESKHYTVIIVGNEQVGIPNEILAHSEHIYIPMPGVGYCLNTSQTANILAYEATKCLSDNFGLCS